MDIRNLRGVIAPTSLLLIVDFWILGTYFAFVAVVNDARLSGRYEGTWSPHSGLAAYWMLWVLSAYLAWDFCVYFLIPMITDPATERFWAQSWMSLFCLPLALAAFFWLGRIRADRPFWILGADISLVALLLFYRSLKQRAKPSLPAWNQFKRMIFPLTGDWELWFARGAFFVFVILGAIAGFYGHQHR